MGSVSGARRDSEREERRGTYECDSKESASLRFDRVEENFIRDIRDPTPRAVSTKCRNLKVPRKQCVRASTDENDKKTHSFKVLDRTASSPIVRIIVTV